MLQEGQSALELLQITLSAPRQHMVVRLGQPVAMGTLHLLERRSQAKLAQISRAAPYPLLLFSDRSRGDAEGADDLPDRGLRLNRQDWVIAGLALDRVLTQHL